MSMNKIESQLPEDISSIAEQVFHIFFIMNKTYPSISGINLDWKEWKEHLHKWFPNKSIDEYCYEPIATCSIFSLDLDLDTYAKMMHLPEELWNKMNYMISEHTEPVRYNRERNTIQPKHDVCADMFFHSHPKADFIRCLIQYLNVTKNTQEIFDNVFRKGKMCRNIISAYEKKPDYQPLIKHIKKIGIDPKNQSRLILACLWNCGSLQEQISYIEKNLINDKLDDLTDFESEKVFTEIAIIYRKVKKYESAEKILWKTLDIDATALPILNELGRLYVDMGNFHQAESLFLKALDMGNLPSYNELGRLYVKIGNFEQAESLFLKALDIDAYSLPILNELGRLYVKMGNFHQAESLFLKALDIDANDLPSLNELGRLYVKIGNFHQAESIFLKALNMGNLPSYNELGRLYVKMGNFEQAESLFLKALEKNIGNDSYFLTSLIKLYSKTKNHKKADELIKKYTNKTTVFYHSFCKYCYIYIKNEKGLKDAIKYKKYIQNYNKKFNI